MKPYPGYIVFILQKRVNVVKKILLTEEGVLLTEERLVFVDQRGMLKKKRKKTSHLGTSQLQR